MTQSKMMRAVKLAFKGLFQTAIYDAQGSRISDLIWSPNGVTNVGKNHALDAIFNGATQITTWYMGLIDSASYTALAASDTMSSHAGWIENTDYTEGTRPTWDPGAASGQAVVNTSLVTFTINATKTLKGVFLTSNSTKGGTTGTLWATALFTSPVSVVSGNTVRNTYTVSAT